MIPDVVKMEIVEATLSSCVGVTMATVVSLDVPAWKSTR